VQSSHDTIAGRNNLNICRWHFELFQFAAACRDKNVLSDSDKINHHFTLKPSCDLLPKKKKQRIENVNKLKNICPLLYHKKNKLILTMEGGGGIKEAQI